MIVDFHVHPARFNWTTEGFERYVGQAWTPQDLARIRQECADGAGFSAYLERAGVDYAVILAELSPATTGEVDNQTVLELCRDQPRLIPFGTINPHLTARPGEEVASLVAAGMRGLKLYPTYNYFYPNDPALYPLYAQAEALHIPVMFHTGSSVFPGSRLKYGDPLLLDDVAVDFPRLTIVLSHAGRPFWHPQAEFLARLHPNVYLDIAGLPPQNLLRYLPNTYRLADKIVFGSDWPGISDIAANIARIRQLPLEPEAVTAILGGNAARLLKLPAGPA